MSTSNNQNRVNVKGLSFTQNYQTDEVSNYGL